MNNINHFFAIGRTTDDINKKAYKDFIKYTFAVVVNYEGKEPNTTSLIVTNNKCPPNISVK